MDNTIKISDFGLAKDTNVIPDPNNPSSSTVVGTRPYTPPEVWNTGKWDFKGDIWSLGVVVYRLHANRFPYSTDNLLKPTANITQDVTCDPGMPLDFRSFVNSCLKIKLSDRASIEQLKLHRLCNITSV